jgi:hypothetical protein
MNIRGSLEQFVGGWSATYRLWLTPADPVRESASRAELALAAGRGFATLRYVWEDRGKPHDGLLIIRNAPEPDLLDMVWVDSFHTAGKFMTFRGEPTGDGSLSALGSWAAPPGPDWGWRIVLSAETESEPVVRMYVITPDGETGLAVESRYSRA